MLPHLQELLALRSEVRGKEPLYDQLQAMQLALDASHAEATDHRDRIISLEGKQSGISAVQR